MCCGSAACTASAFSIPDYPHLIPKENAKHADDCYGVSREDLIIEVEEGMQDKTKKRYYRFETLFNQACKE